MAVTFSESRRNLIGELGLNFAPTTPTSIHVARRGPPLATTRPVEAHEEADGLSFARRSLRTVSHEYPHINCLASWPSCRAILLQLPPPKLTRETLNLQHLAQPSACSQPPLSADVSVSRHAQTAKPQHATGGLSSISTPSHPKRLVSSLNVSGCNISCRV